MFNVTYTVLKKQVSLHIKWQDEDTLKLVFSFYSVALLV